MLQNRAGQSLKARPGKRTKDEQVPGGGLMAFTSTFLPYPAPYSVSVGHKEVTVPVEKE